MFKVIFIVLATFILFFVVISFVRNYKLGLVNKNETINQKQGRKVYDFEKLLAQKFISYKNIPADFSIEYPQEAEIYDFGNQVESDFKLEPLKAEGGINISVVSQLAEGTELFDGLHIDITYYKNSSKLSLGSLIDKVRKPYENSNPPQVQKEEKISINNSMGYLFVHNDWGGESVNYYFFSKGREYIVHINVFSVGPDKEKFDKVANKIVSTLKTE